MYTVLRVLGDDPAVDLTPFVDAANTADFLPPLTKMAKGPGFVTTLCDLPTWEAHLSAIQAAAIALRSSLQDQSRDGARPCRRGSRT